MTGSTHASVADNCRLQQGWWTPNRSLRPSVVSRRSRERERGRRRSRREMPTMAGRSVLSAAAPSLQFPSSAASSFLFIFFFLVLLVSPSSSSSSLAAAADHESDGTATNRPPLQLPTVSLSLSLSVFGAMQANPFGFVIKLPLAEQAEPQHPNQQPPDEQEQLLKPGAPLQPQASSRWGKCFYTVTIKTSCSSPRVTRDAVSLAFGDAYRNEVYAARLDDPASGTFERCSIDTFRVAGPCGGRTCYLYLYRSGRDGWIPEYVKVFYSPSDPRAAVTFFYKVPLPEGVWYGFNLCHGSAEATTPSTTLDLGSLGQKRGVTDGDLPTTTAAGTQTGAGRPQPA